MEKSIKTRSTIEYPFIIIVILTIVLAGCQSKSTGEDFSGRETIMEFGHEMVFIPSNCFIMGDNPWYLGTSNTKHKVCLDDYYIDQYEVTNQQYLAFLEAKDYSQKDVEDLLDLDGEYGRIKMEGNEWSIVSGYENHPVVEVTWFGAQAYCEWRGSRLPTSAEWEYAAGGPENNPYPWGSKPPKDCMANYYQKCAGGTTPVGSYPQDVSVFGAFDLGGNVSEWVYDWYGEDYYFFSPRHNPQGPTEGAERVRRGGAWNWLYVSGSLVQPRFRSEPSESYSFYGFRCAKSP